MALQCVHFRTLARSDGTCSTSLWYRLTLRVVDGLVAIEP